MRAARIAVMVLGMLGGALGVVVALTAIALGYTQILANQPGAVVATLLAAAAVPLSVVAIMAAYVARYRAGVACPILLAAAVLGFVTMLGFGYVLWFIPGLLLLVAGGIAYFVRRTDIIPPREGAA